MDEEEMKKVLHAIKFKYPKANMNIKEAKDFIEKEQKRRA